MANMREAEMVKCYVYRLTGHGGDLLYVGMSVDPSHRTRTHAHKWWWPQVDKITAEAFGSRREARQAELNAIASESPRYNISDNPQFTSPDKIAKSLGMSSYEFWRSGLRHTLPVTRPGQAVKSRRADVEAWIADQIEAG